MKKYWISKHYLRVFVVELVFLLAWVLAVIYWLTCEISWLSTLVAIFTLIGLINFLYILFFDFQFRTFVVSDQGITMNIGFRQWGHTWEQFKEAGIVGVHLRTGSSYWVYFSERPLSSLEKRLFLCKTRKDLNAIAFFQYNEKALQEILPLAPSKLSEIIQREAEQIKPMMRWKDRMIINR